MEIDPPPPLPTATAATAATTTTNVEGTLPSNNSTSANINSSSGGNNLVEILRRVQLTRRLMEAWVDDPEVEEMFRGCYVRVIVSKPLKSPPATSNAITNSENPPPAAAHPLPPPESDSTGATTTTTTVPTAAAAAASAYRICEVVGITSEPGREYKLGEHSLTNKYVTIRYYYGGELSQSQSQSQTCPCRIDRISNTPFSPQEVEAWAQWIQQQQAQPAVMSFKDAVFKLRKVQTYIKLCEQDEGGM